MRMYKGTQMENEDRLTFGDSGFTLVELIVVVVIIGILAAIAIFGIRGARESSVVAACRADSVTFLKAIESYKLREGSYPNNLQIGESLSSDDVQTMISAGYLRKNMLFASSEYNFAAIIGSNGVTVLGSFTSPSITSTCKAP